MQNNYNHYSKFLQKKDDFLSHLMFYDSRKFGILSFHPHSSSRYGVPLMFLISNHNGCADKIKRVAASRVSGCSMLHSLAFV
jgi:hypothetical protein